MPKSFVNIWVHVIWTTKNREPRLTKSIRFKLFRHMKEYAVRNKIDLDIINGVEDHVHCLIRISSTQSISAIVSKLKGESSFWLTENGYKINWQEGYGAFSIDHQSILGVRKYIYDQEQHHQERSYPEEIKELTRIK
ncbi:MAG: IS200/IS605 family transposase [Balneolaceae bacterium]|nr:IS200/IS605 family transposase [Balneolaceae bacterium]MBO6546672.1 IS200/IS605 family transposase [Balneolaceae bacterium]MBO6649030.1 IS200/IS605 family transposase [Balneolaceae bacterium]